MHMDMSDESSSKELEEETTASESEGESEAEQKVGVCLFFFGEVNFYPWSHDHVRPALIAISPT
jgi:hypothetical protein